MKVLVVDDNDQEIILLRERFARIETAEYELEWQSSYDQALKDLADNRHHVCMVNYRLGAASGVELIRAALERGSTVPMILLAGQGPDEVAMEAIRSGALDFLTKKEIGGPALERSLRYAVERGRQLSALQQSEARYQLAMDAGRVGVWDWDIQAGTIHIAPNLKNMLGYAEDDIGNRYDDWMQHIAPEDRERVAGEVRSVLRGDREELRVELRLTCRDGSRRWFLSRGQAVRDKSGTALRMMGTDTDITERKQAEEALQLSEERLSKIVDTAVDGIITIDEGQTIQMFNRGAETIFGYTSKEIIGRPLADIIPTEFRDLHEGYVAAFGAGKDDSRNMNVRGDVFGLRKNGEVFSAEASISKLVVRGARSYTVSIRDVTKRKRAEENLRTNERLLQIVFDTIPAAVYVKDTEGRYIMANHALSDYLGHDIEKLLSSRFADLGVGTAEEIERAEESDRRVLENGETIDIAEESLTHANGEVRWRHTRKAPLYDGPGNLIGLVGVREDITERKQAEERLKQQQLQLIRADKMASLGVLVAGVAHEISNPNTAIMLNVPLLGRMWDDVLPVLEQYHRENPNFTISNLPFEQALLEIPKLLAGISGGSQRVKHTVDNLKNFGRLNENREMNRISINDVVEFAVSLLRSQINKYTDRFSVKYGSEIPPFDGDFQEIEQVVINLINNACQALTDRKREVCVATNYDSKSRKIQVEVADEGAGIPEEILDKIMDPFFTTKGDAGGTGLGLSVSFGILKEHHGSLEIASTVGSGTRATMILPPA